MKKHLSLFMFLLIAGTALAQSPEAKLKELKIELFTPPAPMANYVRAVRTGNLIYLAGHGPTRADGTNIQGKVGRDLTVEQGYGQPTNRNSVAIYIKVRDW